MNRVAIITGATGLIGQVITKKLIKKGYVIIGIARSEERLYKLRDSFGELNSRFIAIAENINEPTLEEKIIKEVEKYHNIESVLINNARSIESLKVGKDGQSCRDEIIREYETNVVSPYRIIYSLAKSTHLNLKSVVNIGSIYGVVSPNPMLYGGTLKESPIQYGMSKAALHHMTKELAVRFREKRIRINAVAFGGVKNNQTIKFQEKYSSISNGGSMIDIEDITGPIEFLISSESNSINGQTLIADDGLTLC